MCVGLGHRRSNSAQIPGRYHQNSSSSNTTATPTPTSGSPVDVGVADCSRSSLDNSGSVGVAEGESMVHGSSGSSSVDKALVQHLIHCESLLVVSVLK